MQYIIWTCFRNEDVYRLAATHNVVSSRKCCLYFQFIRFWGKVLGTMKNYYVAEVEFGDGDYESELDEDEEFGSELNNMVITKKCLVVLTDRPKAVVLAWFSLLLVLCQFWCCLQLTYSQRK